ncbi:MAG: peroxidase [Flavobacteriales bacterium]|nr:MAG: peroxidase [Flavobacteriales bacterium]
MAHIDVISYEDSEGRLREVYDEIIAKRGKLAEVMKIQSLNPESIVKHMDLYLEVMYGRSPLVRYRREMLAVVVSATNKCEYCTIHHAVALNHFWKDQKKIDDLVSDYSTLDLSDMDRTLCQYAKELTLNPAGMNSEKHVENLRAVGLDDRAIMDAALIIAYFNFTNRTILGLGVGVGLKETEGYKYD